MIELVVPLTFTVSPTQNACLHWEIIKTRCLSVPLTFSDDDDVTSLFNTVLLIIFNDDDNVELFFNIVKLFTFNNDDSVVVVLTNKLFKVENLRAFRFENRVTWSDVISFASIFFN